MDRITDNIKSLNDQLSALTPSIDNLIADANRKFEDSKESAKLAQAALDENTNLLNDAIELRQGVNEAQTEYERASDNMQDIGDILDDKIDQVTLFRIKMELLFFNLKFLFKIQVFVKIFVKKKYLLIHM